MPRTFAELDRDLAREEKLAKDIDSACQKDFPIPFELMAETAIICQEVPERHPVFYLTWHWRTAIQLSPVIRVDGLAPSLAPRWHSRIYFSAKRPCVELLDGSTRPLTSTEASAWAAAVLLAAGDR